MPHVVRAQGQVCAQNPTTANPTRQQWFSNGSNPFQNAPHPCQDAPHPPPERPNLAGEFLGRLGRPHTSLLTPWLCSLLPMLRPLSVPLRLPIGSPHPPERGASGGW